MPEAPLDDVAIDDLVSDYLAQRRRGEHVSVTEFASQHPHWEAEIRQLLPAALAMERLRRRRKVTEELDSQAGELLKETRLGDFELLDEIGHGGMGVVYKARQTSLGRIVAVKVLRAGAMAVEKHARRFEREAQAAARLHHTNIVPVFGVGRQNGIHYYVMQLIEGEGLDQVIAELGKIEYGDTGAAGATNAANKAPPAQISDVARILLGTAEHCDPIARDATLHGLADDTEDASREGSEIIGEGLHSAESACGGSAITGDRSTGIVPKIALTSPRSLGHEATNHRRYWRSVARIGLETARALEYAHRQGTLHRDVKPGNLIVDRRGTVWITDFGLAKLLHNDSLTETGDVVGTLRYMSPEQFRGEADGRSDVYGLGVTLYELVTLRPAFDASGRAGLLDQILRQEPVRPRKLRPSVPRDLETILLKAIAREPNHRYATAGEMADDLARFLDDRPVRARRIGPVERFWRWCRRNPATAIPTAAAVVLLLLACTLATAAFVRESSLRATAEFQTERAESQRQRAQTEAQRAEANLELALEAFEEVFERIAPTEFHRTGDEELAESHYLSVSAEDAALLESMLIFYDRFAEANTTNRELQSEAAKAHRRVGDIHMRLGQFLEAETAYLRALALYQQLDQSHPLRVATTLNELGQVRTMMYRRDEARKSHSEALEILESEYRVSPDSAEITLELVRTHNLLGYEIWGRGHWRGWGKAARDDDDDVKLVTQAESNHRKALELVEKLIESDPQNPEYQLTLARSYRDLAPVLARRFQRRSAADVTKEAIKILEKLVADYPSVPLYRFELVCTLSPIDSNNWGECGLEEARIRFERAIEMARELSDEFPDVPIYSMRYAYAYHRYGDELEKQKLRAEAEKMRWHCVALRREQTERFPDVPHCRMYHASACTELAEMIRVADPAEAKLLLKESIELLTSMEELSSTYLRVLKDDYANLGLILRSEENHPAANEAYASAHEIHVELEKRERRGPSRINWSKSTRTWRPSQSTRSSLPYTRGGFGGSTSFGGRTSKQD